MPKGRDKCLSGHYSTFGRWCSVFAPHKAKATMKPLIEARVKENEHMARCWGTNADVSLCCGPNGCPKAVANVTRAIASPLGARKIYSPLSSSKASEVTNKSQIEQNGWHGATIGNKHRCHIFLHTQWMPKSSCECHLGHCVAFGRVVSAFPSQQPQS